MMDQTVAGIGAVRTTIRICRWGIDCWTWCWRVHIQLGFHGGIHILCRRISPRAGRARVPRAGFCRSDGNRTAGIKPHWSPSQRMDIIMNYHFRVMVWITFIMLNSRYHNKTLTMDLCGLQGVTAKWLWLLLRIHNIIQTTIKAEYEKWPVNDWFFDLIFTCTEYNIWNE